MSKNISRNQPNITVYRVVFDRRGPLYLLPGGGRSAIVGCFFTGEKLTICDGWRGAGKRRKSSESQFSIFPSTCQLKIDSITPSSKAFLLLVKGYYKIKNSRFLGKSQFLSTSTPPRSIASPLAACLCQSNVRWPPCCFRTLLVLSSETHSLAGHASNASLL